MPLFNEASRIYKPEEVTFMRSCFSHAAIILEESDREYAATDLSTAIIMLYQNGLRDLNYIAELASRLAHKRYQDRHAETPAAANLNIVPDSEASS
ncbi:hypothetical protein F9K88_13825 [Brucella intermedia]|uniref:Uncharacterized protein n=2 Tax=Brucella intermedia TaxID=94625 RepID=A0A5N7NUS1_9HYPH|nr:hypothetical protein [Brucella intermedia]PJR93232.1 hypothetical protein CN881_06805 [Ochrobactrum sp. 721/2009]PJT15230.1 hypothetical protein CN880_14500 [Ochrobactrum sp. 720/2009]PJT23185.1 hypothetical protein CN879_09945 [Ochrobactrum sp. 715/2009]PJT24827.1 hypothetical protein CN884_07890 [Ochrobactrum sp. 30A/1000/2015]PJT29008.1 hypothetical protein CN878_14575 [Ochrobactrum sp. 695/2009]PJT32514.1 hypothetical protein CN877_19710 [Ochrobactrum sp. 689/2009]PJT40276.1 hypotheti